MRKVQIIPLIIAAFMITQLLVATPSVRGQENDDREKRSVHLNLKPDDVLSPETNPDAEAEPEKKMVMAQYDRYFGYPGTRSNRRQVDAGTWTTRNIGGAMTIEAGTFTFNVWSQEYQSDYAGQPDWEFYLYHNDEQIAHAQVSNAESSKDRPVEVRAEGNIASNRDVQPGDTLKINIKYTAWEDCDIYFDTMEFDSGGTGRMDSIQILSAGGGTPEVRFFDTFAIDWQSLGKFFCSVNTTDSLWYGDNHTGMKEGDTYEDPQGRTYGTTILMFESPDIPDGIITVTITYGPSGSGSEGWSLSYQHDATPPTADAGPDQIVDEGATVTFNGSASMDNVGIVNYTWTFHDGMGNSTLYGPTPKHTFTIPGTYNVTLAVTDTAGNNDIDTMTVKVLIVEVTFQVVSISPEQPRDGDTATITVTLNNTGEALARNVTVKVNVNNVLIKTLVFDDIPVGKMAALQFTWTVQQGNHTLLAELTYTRGEDTHTQTFEVRKKDSDSPGFEVLGALAAVGFAVVVFGKRRG